MSPRFTRGQLAALGLLSALLLSACKADDLNIVVLNARSPGTNCDFSDDSLYQARGSLDLTPYYTVNPVTNPGALPAVSRRYYQVFSWQNNLTAIPLSVGGQVIDNGSGNNFIADSAVYSYQYSDPSVALSNETENIRAVIAAGGLPGDNSVPADLLQPNAEAAIEASTGIDGKSQTLVVTFQYFGKLAGGSSKYTNKVTFPLTIYRRSKTPVNCFATSQVLDTGPCGEAGRDQDVSCKTP
jgi:hypothetical protein